MSTTTANTSKLASGCFGSCTKCKSGIYGKQKKIQCRQCLINSHISCYEITETEVSLFFKNGVSTFKCDPCKRDKRDESLLETSADQSKFPLNLDSSDCAGSEEEEEDAKAENKNVQSPDPITTSETTSVEKNQNSQTSKVQVDGETEKNEYLVQMANNINNMTNAVRSLKEEIRSLKAEKANMTQTISEILAVVNELKGSSNISNSTLSTSLSGINSKMHDLTVQNSRLIELSCGKTNDKYETCVMSLENSNSGMQSDSKEDSSGWVTKVKQGRKRTDNPRGKNGKVERKPKSTAIMGSKEDSSLTVAPKNNVTILQKKAVFVSRLAPNISSKNLKEWLVGTYNFKTVNCLKFRTKHDDLSSSFYVSSGSDEFEALLDPDKWPVGVIVKKFRGRLYRTQIQQEDGAALDGLIASSETSSAEQTKSPSKVTIPNPQHKPSNASSLISSE